MAVCVLGGKSLQSGIKLFLLLNLSDTFVYFASVKSHKCAMYTLLHVFKE